MKKLVKIFMMISILVMPFCGYASEDIASTEDTTSTKEIIGMRFNLDFPEVGVVLDSDVYFCIVGENDEEFCDSYPIRWMRENPKETDSETEWFDGGSVG